MIEKLVEESFNRLQNIYTDVWLDFWELSDVQIEKMNTFILESLYSPRWTNTLYPQDGSYIKELEITRWDKSKYQLLKRYDIPFNNFNHGNVLWHTLFLIDLLDIYPSDLSETQIKTLKKAFIIHDLSEVQLWDHSQLQWTKTPEFKQAEKIAGREIISEIYQDRPNIQKDMLEIDNQLDDKQGWLYRILKVYEEISHLLWSIEMIEHGLFLYSDVLDWVQWHIDKLLSRKDEYPFIENFLHDVKNRLPDNDFGSIK